MAENAGIECMIGCMLESKVSVTTAHLAAAKSIITRCDLDAPILCREDPIEGGPLSKGDPIALSDQPGLGIKALREGITPHPIPLPNGERGKGEGANNHKRKN